MSNNNDQNRDAEQTADPTVLHKTTHDWTGSRSVSETIQEAISTVDPDYDPTSGRPLYSVIDADCLEKLFSPVGQDRPREKGAVTFQYEGYWITAFADGRVKVVADDFAPTDFQNY